MNLKVVYYLLVWFSLLYTYIIFQAYLPSRREHRTRPCRDTGKWPHSATWCVPHPPWIAGELLQVKRRKHIN